VRWGEGTSCILKLFFFFFVGVFWLTLGKREVVKTPAESQESSLCQYPCAGTLQLLEGPFNREEQVSSVELVSAPLGWMESKEGTPSVGTNLLVPAALSQRVLCQEGLNCTFSETQLLRQLLVSSFQTSLQFLK